MAGTDNSPTLTDKPFLQAACDLRDTIWVLSPMKSQSHGSHIVARVVKILYHDTMVRAILIASIRSNTKYRQWFVVMFKMLAVHSTCMQLCL